MYNSLRQRPFLSVSSVLLLLWISTCTSIQESEPGKPNIVLFLADDLGYGDLGCYGNTEIRTPQIDRLAGAGVRFTSFYSNGPECTPTRTALLTGRYQQRVGGLECAIGIGNVGRYDDAIRLRETHDLGLPPRGKSLPQQLKDAGYNTAICGKWHLGYEDKFSPNKHGFDYAFYAIGGAMDYFHHVEPPGSKIHALYLNGNPVKRSGYFSDLITEESIEFLKRQTAEKPFFLYVPYTSPHSPYQGQDDYTEEPLPDNSTLWNQSRGPKQIYRAMVEDLDKSVGRIVDALKKQDFNDNTVVIFMSDNGASASGTNFPLRGNKGSLFEGAIRVPCILTWPGVVSANMISDQACLTMDFTASLINLASDNVDSDRNLDGIDILELIKGKKDAQSRTLFWRARRGTRTVKAVRDADLKYVHVVRDSLTEEYLFDLSTDMGEESNLIQSRLSDANKLKDMLANWEVDVKPQR